MRLSKMLLAAGALALAAGPAMAQKKYSDGASDTEIKIGHTNPYSGPASAYGQIGKTIEAFFKMVNDTGGVNVTLRPFTPPVSLTILKKASMVLPIWP